MIENGFVRLEGRTELGTANILKYGAVRRVMRSRFQIGQMMRQDWRLYGIKGPYIEVCTTHGFPWHVEYVSSREGEDPDFVIAETWGQTNSY